jgi:hypothetical protein
MCCLLWRIYEMHPALFLKSECDRTLLMNGLLQQAAEQLRMKKTRIV